jgi:hypothetical protein
LEQQLVPEMDEW